MKKVFKITLITLGSLIAIIAIAAFGGWMYFKSTLLSFEDNDTEKREIKEISIDEYTFADRNGNGKLDTYEDDRRSIDERVKDLLSQMTLEEKIHLLKGSGLGSALGREKGLPGAVGTIVPTPRLGIPTIYLSDGPAGLRIEPKREGEDKTYYCTAFPIGTLLASTWNTALVGEVGKAMGNEALEYGVDVILGPGVNIHRNPLCGRNFEYYSEDPVLTGRIGAAMVNGIESNGVGTSVKHFAANNQETNRNHNDVIISERALREIYLKGFEIIVKESQPWTIMSSYNKINGTFTSQDKHLLTTILRDDWKFEGLVMSDWFGGEDATAQIIAGNDLLEPGTKKQWDALKETAENGTLTAGQIDLTASRILKLILTSKKMQSHPYGNNPDLKAHALITRQSASEGMVLLKNEKALPIAKGKNVALLGTNSYDFIAGGTGSGDVNEAYTVSLEQALKEAGFEINATAQNAFYQHREQNKEAFVKPEGMSAMFTPYTPPQMRLSTTLLNEIVATADMAIITIGRNSGEGADRHEENDFLLSAEEQELISATCDQFHAKGKPVVVVLNIGGVIETASWNQKPDAILLAWQGGQEGGNSVADILSGEVSPSGKLTMTFPVKLNDHASSANFPLNGKPMELTSMLFSKEKPDNKKIQNEDYTKYEEGIYVGYRHFDKANLAVSYPFGYGLSYTSFEFGKMNTTVLNDTIKVAIKITNTGDRPGKEVVQFYSSKPGTTIDRPVRELKAFAKTPLLKPGESTDLSIVIPVSALSYWNESISAWAIEKGKYMIASGASSRDIKQTIEVEIE